MEECSFLQFEEISPSCLAASPRNPAALSARDLSRAIFHSLSLSIASAPAYKITLFHSLSRSGLQDRALHANSAGQNPASIASISSFGIQDNSTRAQFKLLSTLKLVDEVRGRLAGRKLRRDIRSVRSVQLKHFEQGCYECKIKGVERKFDTEAGRETKVGKKQRQRQPDKNSGIAGHTERER